MKTYAVLALAGLILTTFYSDSRSEVASYYRPGVDHVGGRTASGERFTGNDMTAAHRTLPFGTWSMCATAAIA